MTAEAPDPKTLASWQDAFQYPIPAVRRMETQLRSDIAVGREKIRGLVRASYRDLLGTAERIVAMDEVMGAVDDNLAVLGKGCGVRAVEGKVRGLSKWEARRERRVRETQQYALASQLYVLQACPHVLTRLLRHNTGSSLLAAAKILVLARLLHKSLSSQQSHPPTGSVDVAPFVDSLRTRLASLRRKLLVSVDRRLARPPNDDDDRDGDEKNKKRTTDADLLGAMCAFSLATSSLLPKDVLRHFLHVRREALIADLTPQEDGDTNDNRDKILTALRLYVRTLQDTQRLFPKRLAEALSRLKTGPLLADRDIRGVTELGLDVHEKWIAEEVRNFTPWVQHEDLAKADVEAVSLSWSKSALGVFLSGFDELMQDSGDLQALARLRKDMLETWLTADIETNRSGVVDGMRAALNGHFSRIIRQRVDALDGVASHIGRAMDTWQPGVSDLRPSLWAPDLTHMDVSHAGAPAFHQAILARTHGRNPTLSALLAAHAAWLRTTDDIPALVADLQRTKWSADSDVEFDPEPLNHHDPHLLQQVYAAARSAASARLHACLAHHLSLSLDPDISIAKTSFLLRLARDLRLPLRLRDPLPPALARLAAHVLRPPLARLSAYPKGLLRTRTIWTRAGPVVPSPLVYSFLYGLVTGMVRVGGDLWCPLAVAAVKRGAREGLVGVFERALAQAGGDEGDGDGGDGEAMAMAMAKAEAKGEWRLQLLFDGAFLDAATRLDGDGNDEEDAFGGVVRDLMRRAEDEDEDDDDDEDGAKEGRADKVREAARGYWGKVRLVFGILG